MLIKTSEAIGSQLDWLVATCESFKVKINYLGCIHRLYFDHPPNYPFSPIYYSTNWAQGGPIIERERVKVFPNVGGTWSAQIRHTESHPLVSHPVLAGWTNSSGPTPLIAAMRCYVSAKIGDEVEIPNELQGVT